jgi:hypothetical protein
MLDVLLYVDDGVVCARGGSGSARARQHRRSRTGVSQGIVLAQYAFAHRKINPGLVPFRAPQSVRDRYQAARRGKPAVEGDHVAAIPIPTQAAIVEYAADFSVAPRH